MAKEICKLWPKVLDELKGRVTPQQFQTWFAHIQPVAREGERDIELRVPTEYHKEWLTKSYKGLLEEVLSSVSKDIRDIRFTAERDVPGSLGMESYNYLNRNYSFDNFVVGPSNRLAHAAAVAIAKSAGRAYNPLFLHGGVGLGKTHLLHAICLSLLDDDPNLRILYLPCESFMNHFIATVRNGRWESFRSTYRDVDVLVIDDIHFLSRSQRSREEFFHTFNALYNSQKQIVLSSVCSPEDIPAIEERLVSRFKWGLSAKIDPPDLETRIAIIEKKTLLLNIQLPPDVTMVFAEGITCNVREIEGAIIRFSRYTSLERSSSAVDFARRVVKELTSEEVAPVSIEKILAAVASSFSLSLSQLQSRRRTRSLATARQVAMYLSRRLTKHSLQEIGGYIGGRDHSTVIHAEERVRTAKSKDKSFALLVDEIERNLQEGGG
ncbi:MAG: chromosomal replication initiator protein DnaA [Candidatus Brocadiales bacterium]